LWGFFVLFCAVLVYFIFPLWWENYRTTSEAPYPELEAEGRTPKLHLNLEFFYFLLYFFIYIYIFFHLFFIFNFFKIFYFNPLSVSLMPFQLMVE
jgi:hypothetical protein